MKEITEKRFCEVCGKETFHIARKMHWKLNTSARNAIMRKTSLNPFSKAPSNIDTISKP